MLLPIAIIVGTTGTYGGTNAGTASANGIYVQITGVNATFNGVTQFTNGTYFIAWDGSTYWNIWTGVNGTGMQLYSVSGGSSTSIPSTGWTVVLGVGSAPTLALITTGLAVYYTVTNPTLANAGAGIGNATFLPLSGVNTTYSGITQYSNATNYISWLSDYWNMNPSVNTVGGTSLYSPGFSLGTTFPLTGWTDGNGASPAPTFSAASMVSYLGGLTMTLERASIYEGSQIGPESTPGIAVAATRRLFNTAFMPDIAPDITDVRTQGEKFDTDVAIGKEYTTGKTTGKAAYYDLVYLMSSCITLPIFTTPVNNSTWSIACTTIVTNTFGMTFQNKFGVSATLAAASYATVAALQTAIQGMASIGIGNVKVTGTVTAITIQFIGALSTDTSVPTFTGTATPVATAQATATNTRRATFTMNPWGPETNIQTFTLEKGIPATANLAQQIAQLTMTGLQLAFSNKEATTSGDFIGITAADPFTMTTGLTSANNIASAPINPKDVSVFVGTSLFGTGAVARLSRVFALEWGCNGRQTPVMTIDDSISSFSNTVEAEGVKWTAKMTMSQDAYGQAQLANLRTGTVGYRVIEAKGTLIETGFPLRFKITEKFKLNAGPKTDTDGVYVGAYESNAIFDGTTNGLTGAFLIEIDTPLTAIS